jgi:mono/diheme cytochrome c family protein
MRSTLRGLFVPALAAAAIACSSEEATTPGSTPSSAAPPANGAPADASPVTAAPAATSAPADPPPRTGDVAKGRQLFVTNCGICHATDPTLPGTIGPEVAGASRELVVRRVLHGDYPPGYTPKRQTGNMVAMPHLAPVIDDIAAYLASVPPAK